MRGNLDFEYLATALAMATWWLEASEHDKSAAPSFRRNDSSRVESINLRCLNYSIRERETRRAAAFLRGAFLIEWIALELCI